MPGVLGVLVVAASLCCGGASSPETLVEALGGRLERDKEGGIREVSLSGTDATDKDLAQLTGLAALKTLGLWGTQVTDAGVAELRKALPNCVISI